MFENLSDRLERSFKILKGEGKITEMWLRPLRMFVGLCLMPT